MAKVSKARRFWLTYKRRHGSSKVRIILGECATLEMAQSLRRMYGCGRIVRVS
jgi:hypothetical protein